MDSTKPAFILEKQDVGKTLTIPSELVPYEKAEINARVEGFVKNVNVDIGDKVKQGQVLAVLDAPEAVARYAEATAKLHEANARYMSTKDRSNRLQEASKEQGVIAEGELITARNQMLADSAAYASANSTAQAYRQLQNYLTIRAPFAGMITSRSIDQGDLVGGGSTNKTLFTLVTPDRLRLRVHVPEAYVNSIPSAQNISFTSDGVLNQSFQAELARKSGSIDPSTRTEMWEYEYTNQEGLLKPGMYTIAELNLGRSASSFVVPYTAIVTTQEKRFVVRVKDEKTEWIDVRQGISMGEGAEIFGDLSEGDTILVRGSEEIRPGTEINTSIEQQ